MANKKTKPIYNYSLDLDKQTQEQFKSCYEKPFVTAAALMPDAHLGYVAPIGSVLITSSYVVPAWVGFDIGCGVIAIQFKTKNKKIDLISKVKQNEKEIYNSIKRKVPIGLGETNTSSHPLHEKTYEKLKILIKNLELKPHDRKILNHIKQIAQKHLGTLGSGNHFISLNTNENKKELWLVIHCGSRGLGHEVAKKYMIKSSGSEKKSEYESTFPLQVNSQLGEEYLALLDFGIEYAFLNRLEISYRIQDALESVLKVKLSPLIYANKSHNHAILEKGKYVHRKGATPAKKSEKGIIPANMRDGSYLVEGLGNPKFLNSSSHGAGRAMSRKQARNSLSIAQFKAMVPDVYAEFNNQNLDESPIAYKPIQQVMEAQKQSVKITKHLIPLINWQT